MKLFATILFVMLKVSPSSAEEILLIHASQQLLLAVKSGEDFSEPQTAIATASESDITSQLSNDNLKKTFWINIYNAYVQILLHKDSTAYNSRNNFFSSPVIEVAGKIISLDFIEHGILRRSKIKISMGYLNKPFPSSLEKKWRVQTLDNRIHFALNCGAKSCPPIAFYSPLELDKQLDMARAGYLSAECDYDSIAGTIAVPKILEWFRGDFGGKKGIVALLQQQNIIPEKTKPAIIFKEYNWQLVLSNYANR